MRKLITEDGTFIEIKKEDLKFAGDTEELRKANESIYDLSLENESLHNELKCASKEIKNLKAEIQEINTTQKWWTDKGNSLSKKYNESINKLKKAYKYINKHDSFDSKTNERYLHLNGDELEELEEILNIEENK